MHRFICIGESRILFSDCLGRDIAGACHGSRGYYTINRIRVRWFYTTTDRSSYSFLLTPRVIIFFDIFQEELTILMGLLGEIIMLLSRNVNGHEFHF